MSAWAGVFPYLPSPLTREGEVDTAVLQRIVRHCVDAGVHGLTPLGSSGEFPYLSAAQRATVIEATVEAADGRVPVVSGVSGYDAATLVAAARDALRAGSDGILLVPLAYFPLRTVELLGLIGAVADHVDAPIVLYNHPHLTHVPFTTEVVVAAHRELGIGYLKDASGDLRNISTWSRATGRTMGIFSATAVPPVAAMLQGACGWMSGPASAFPAESVAIYERARVGDWPGAAAAEEHLQPALDIFRAVGPGRGVKAMFRVAGWDVGQPAAPLAPLEEAELRSAREQLAPLLESMN